MPEPPLVELLGVHREYATGRETAGLHDVWLQLPTGSRTALVGRSGSGKTTVLNLLGCLDRPTGGIHRFDGVDVGHLPDRERTALRRDHIGLVFQGFHLIPALTLAENVELGLAYRGLRAAEVRASTDAALADVGLGGRGDEVARTLSGGEQQRVAIARALVGRPRLLLADEPTGNLDSATATSVLDLLDSVAAASGATLVVVTHDRAVADRFPRVVEIEDGRATLRPSGTVGTDRPVVFASPAATDGTEPTWATGRRMPRRRWWTMAARVASRRARTTASCAAAVALAVALVVAALGLGEAARSQVSDVFDAEAARRVRIGVTLAEERGPDRILPTLDLDGLCGLAGVQACGAAELWDDQVVRTSQGEITATVARSAGDLLTATGAEVTWARGGRARWGTEGILVGEGLADRLAIGPLHSGPEIEVADRRRAVIGVITSASEPALLGAAVDPTAEPPAYTSAVVAHALTVPGAARAVSRQARLALDPYEPDRVTVAPVPDLAAFRGDVEGSLRAVLLALAVVTILGAGATLLCVMSLAVSGRAVELGLRRALGARRSDLAGQIAAESVLLGLVGGMTGLALSFVGLQAAFAVQGWRPVFDPRLGLLAVVLGTALGAGAGAVPAYASSRADPVAALRGLDRS